MEEFNVNDQNALIINDAGLVALLRYLKYNPLAVSASSRIVSFQFPRKSEILKIVSQYELGLTLEIEPFRLIEAFKNTKGLIYRTLSQRNPGKIDYYGK